MREGHQGTRRFRNKRGGILAALDFATECTVAVPELLDAVDAAEKETRKVRDVLRALLDAEGWSEGEGGSTVRAFLKGSEGVVALADAEEACKP